MIPEGELRALRGQRFLSRCLGFLPHAAFRILERGRLHYTYPNLSDFRRMLQHKLQAHRGPLIYAANHCTLADPWLVARAALPWHRLWSPRALPWNLPDRENYYRLGGWPGRLLRAALYLGRCIPTVRQGEDEASRKLRELAFEKCVWALREGDPVFVFPEAGRSRNAWLDPDHPKDFVGRLVLAAPGAAVLCIYLRGEAQRTFGALPGRRERFRMYADLLVPERREGVTPREVAAQVYRRLGELQEAWFSETGLPRNCGGNDVVDLSQETLRKHFEPEPEPAWLERHLTPRELKDLSGEDPYVGFWKRFAAKEAAAKALAQAGILLPRGGYHMLEADLFHQRVTHLPSGSQVEIAFPEQDSEKIHCIAVFRGGGPEDVLWGVDRLPAGRDASEFARERLLAHLQEASDDIPSPDLLALSEVGGIPRVLYQGRERDWGISLSHSGRFVAHSFMIS